MVIWGVGRIELTEVLKWNRFISRIAKASKGASSMTVPFLLLLLTLQMGNILAVRGQAEPAPKENVACDQALALYLVDAQVAELATSNQNPTVAIPLLVRVADLLWLHNERRARHIFFKAYELAGGPHSPHPPYIAPN